MPPARRSKSVFQTPRTTTTRGLDRSPSADPTRRERALRSTPSTRLTLMNHSVAEEEEEVEEEEFSFHPTPSASRFHDEGGSQQHLSSVLSKSSHPSVALQSPRVTRSSARSRLSRASNVEAESQTPKENTDASESHDWINGLRGEGGEEGKVPVTRSRMVQSVVPVKHVFAMQNHVPRSAMSDQRKGKTLSGMGSGMGLRGRHLGEELETLGEEDHTGGAGTRIMVYVRLRPMSKKEKEGGAESCVRVDNKRDIYLTEFANENDYLRLKRLKGRHFAFDAAFPDTTAQQEVYSTSTAALVEGVLQGRNGSVFCYGATGAGKTHTMLGTVQSPGVMVLALKDLFNKIKLRSTGEHVVKLSYLEVYNETVKDLLSPGRALVLRDDGKQGIIAAGITQYQAYSADEIMTLLHRGNLNRTTEPTRINETSSRSHAILQVVAEYKMQQELGVVSRVGKLSLIDLAGSERALATDQRTLRSVEGANINRSLLALSSCINALCEGKKHIPFRNSKLTQLLKDSLGGACQTAMIANISPSNGSFGETQNTLHWADRAKEIRTKGCGAQEELSVPEDDAEKSKLLHRMQKENQLLRMQVEQLHEKVVGGTPSRTTSMECSQGLAELENVVQVTSPPFATSMVPYPQESPSYAKTPGRLHSTLSTREFPERVTAEQTIRDLQRTIQLLEMDIDLMKRESSQREEKQHQAHMQELKKKDELIQRLLQKSSNDEIGRRSICTPAKRDENNTVGSKRNALEQRRLSTPAVNMKSVSGLPPTGSKLYNLSGRVTRSQVTPKVSLKQSLSSPAKKTAVKVLVPESANRKRTFWDITNLNTSAEMVPSKSTRRNTTAGAKTPSLLLQPGFATQHRLS